MLAKALDSGKMRNFEVDFPASGEQKRLLTFGAILSTQTMESCRTFRLQKEKSSVVSALSSWWGIRDREEALSVLQNLSTGQGHTPRADETYKTEGMENHKATAALLMRLGYSESELSRVSTTIAWDLGRTGAVARWSVKAGYIEEDEAWLFLKTAADNAVQSYHDWREYLSAYTIGRALGYGNDSAQDGMYSVLDYLLHHKNSPFKEVIFNNF
jgi:hypothetical protein